MAKNTILKEIQILKKIQLNHSRKRKLLKVGSWIRCTKCGINTKEYYKSLPYNCKNCQKDRRKQYYQKYTEKQKRQVKLWQLQNKKKQTKYQNKHQVKKYNECDLFKIKHCLRVRLSQFINISRISKNQSSLKYIGCTVNQLKKHLENQFVDGMSWDNYGLHGWHIDHIIPLSLAKTEKDLYKLCHYTNLQPLWAKDNISKSNKIL